MLVFTESFCNAEGKVEELGKNQVFVFGSNLQGHHAGGAARDAMERFGAFWGQGEGPQGNSYAIPTMFETVAEIRPYVDRFIDFARNNPKRLFIVTAVGCGIAGHPLSSMAGLFREALSLDNVVLPKAFYLSILAERCLDASAARWFATGDTFTDEDFSECDWASLVEYGSTGNAWIVRRRGDKLGIFFMTSPDMKEPRQFSLGPLFGLDEVRVLENIGGWDYEKFKYTYIAVREGSHWTVIGVDYQVSSTFLCDGESLDDVTDRLSALAGTWGDPRWLDPFEERDRLVESLGRGGD